MAYARARKTQVPDVPHVDEEVNIHLGLVFQDVADKVAKPLRRKQPCFSGHSSQSTFMSKPETTGRVLMVLMS